MAELVARTDEDFEDLAVALIRQWQRANANAKGGGGLLGRSRHNALRRRLQRRVYRQPHFDARTWVRAWEASAKMAWDLRSEQPHRAVKGAVAGTQLRMAHLCAAQRFRRCPGTSSCAHDERAADSEGGA